MNEGREVRHERAEKERKVLSESYTNHAIADRPLSDISPSQPWLFFNVLSLTIVKRRPPSVRDTLCRA
jgi:hypothetical protein